MAVSVYNSNIVKKYNYNYLYLFMIVLYAGQSGGLNGLVGFDGKQPIVFFIPFFMTAFLLVKNKVKAYNRTLFQVLGILTFWFVLQFIYRQGAINASKVSFHYYQIFLCYIIIQVYKNKLFYIYEDIVYKLALLSIVLWIVSIIIPNQMASFFRSIGNASDTTEGSIYVYCMMQLDRIKGDDIIRNAGFAWEPGRYACFLCLAIFCNLLVNGYKLKKNYRLWVFIIALFTTQSTTGVFTLMAIMAIFVLNKKLHYKAYWLILLVPATIYVYRLDFVGEKTEGRAETQLNNDLNYSTTDAYALDRFESAIIELNNFKHDPLMGYCEWRHSFFNTHIAQGYFVNNGTTTLLAKYGLLGLLWYICIFVSSKRISRFFNDKIVFSYLLLYICIGMGYDFNNIVLIMSFSFWGLFLPDNNLT